MQEAAPGASLDGDVAVQVAAAYPPVQAPQDIGLAVAGEGGREAIGRGVGQHQASQLIEVGQVLAGELRARLQPSEVERPGHRPVRHDVVGAGVQVNVEGVWPVSLHMHQRAAGDVGDERRPVQRPLAVQPERPQSADAGRLAGRDHAPEHQPSLLVDEVQLAVAQDEVLDRRQGRGFAGGPAQRPVLLARGVSIEVRPRMLDPDQG